MLGNDPAAAQATKYPLKLTNCGRTVTFDQAPRRAVSVGQSSTEVLYVLGLADKVVGTAVWFGPVLPGYEEANARVPRLADNDPSFESVIAKKPDLVTAQFQWHVGPSGIVGKPQQFEELGIPTYVSPADCVGKDNSGGGDGTRGTLFTMDLVYQEITELAEIFDVQERGAKVVADLRAREEAARRKIAAGDGKVSAAFWFSSAKVDVDPYMAGKNSVPGYIMSVLGVRNVVESEEEWPSVGWETIAKADPTIIVAGRMDRRRYPADDIAVKLNFLETDPVASLMPAVRQGHVVEMDVQAMQPSIRIVDGIEMLADAIQRFGLKR
ncbi:ABC transporter substrate-binding protein [Labrys sp. LIt4]|uniref:ABC transporter substrate-binding protein n=1 Tax=Labrys sp. LIt4 TaxID=2821355 RepID=UPI001AE0BA52|nr:ABC transporter substrate-binding protein [Labrys sp. LIt4]